MEVNEIFVTLAREQKEILQNLMTRLFDKSLEGLNLAKDEVQNLRDRHAWYQSNIYQLRKLKKTITSIEEKYDQTINEIVCEIREQKEKSKQMLLNALNRLEVTMDKNMVNQYLKELMDEIDRLLQKAAALVFLGSIFGALGLFALIAAILAVCAGSSLLGVTTLGIGAAAGGVTNELLFYKKLSDLIENLKNSINNVRNQKAEQLRKLNRYFDDFEQRLGQHDNHKSEIDIIWIDKHIQSDENQSFADMLSLHFPSGKYRVVQFDNENAVTEFVQSNIESNIILITSGSAGEDVICEVGHYWNLKGIIIYCTRTKHHRLWAGKYKKVLLVTNDSDEVIAKINHIECGDVYFLINGFSFEDVGLKLTNIHYYLSTEEDGFIIPSLKCISVKNSHHRNSIERLYNAIVSKNIYPDGIPHHFQLATLYQFLEEFLEALQQTHPEKSIITLYTKAEPYYYKIINDILNRLDEELISLIGDYIKALRYVLIRYKDTTNTIPNAKNVKVYRGLCLKHGNSFDEFQRKFRVSDGIIFPSFLSTSMSKAKAISFTEGKGILLEISADCTKSNKPKNISAKSYFKGEEEVLLNCFSVMKVMDITKITDNLVSYKCNLDFSMNN